MIIKTPPALSPVFLLAPPRSFTSIVCAMLGQHPEAYGLGELHLFLARSVAHWWRLSERASFHMRDGLLRAVAQLCFGGQAPHTVGFAKGWLRRRSHYTTGMVLEELAGMVTPKRLVEKSPSIVYRVDYMQRAYQMFPQARFIHLTRHPAGQGGSVIKALNKAERGGQPPYWLLNLASYPYWPIDGASLFEALNSNPAAARNGHSVDIDPQRAWYALNRNICEFLAGVPASQQLRVRGEDLLSDPDGGLTAVAQWLGLRTDPDAIEQMKHPERSHYAFFGPDNALLGNDGDFLANPALRPERVTPCSLEGPLPWRSDGVEFSAPVRELAYEFGYH